MIKVIIADDHHLFREGLGRIIKDAPGLELVGCAVNGLEAITLTMEKNPDVILMDVKMTAMGGLEASKKILESHPDVKILMLTISENEEDLFKAIRVGARGYLLKNSSTRELLTAIRQVFQGESPITPRMAAKLVEEYAALPSESIMDEADVKGYEQLTAREEDVLRLVARGMSNKEIGSALSISPLTVKSHLSSILEKLDMRGRVEAAAWAIRHGILRGEDE